MRREKPFREFLRQVESLKLSNTRLDYNNFEFIVIIIWTQFTLRGFIFVFPVALPFHIILIFDVSSDLVSYVRIYLYFIVILATLDRVFRRGGNTALKKFCECEILGEVSV